MSATDARPIPRKNTAYRLYAPLFDADGDLVAGATGLDSELSIDGGTFVECTNEATEIATASGVYFLDLTSAEMNGDAICVIVKTSTVGAKTTPIVLYPEETGDIRASVTAWNGTAVPSEHTAGYPIVTVKDGTGAGELDTAAGVVLARDHAGAALATPTNITAGTITTVTNLTNAPTSGDLTATMKTSVTTAATAATPIAASVTGAVGSVTAGVTVTTNNDKTGYGLSSAAVQAIWDALTSALTTVGSVGKVIADFLTGNAFTRLGAPVGASISADIAGVQADTDNIQTRIPAALVSGRMDASVGAMAADVLTASALATDAVNEIADQVWDEILSGHAGVGSTGAALSAAGGSGDPWSTALPGAYGAGTAGKIIGDNINATVGSRASQTSVDTVDDFLDTEVAAIKAKTDNLPASPANEVTLTTIAGYLDTEVAAIKAKTDALPSDPADQSAVEAAITAATSGLSTASALATVSGLVDDLETRLTATRAGYLDNLSGGAVATQASVNTVDDFLDTEIVAIKAKTDLIPAAPAAVGDVPTATANADALLDRAAGVETSRTVRQALRLMLAALGGKLSGAATTTILVRDTNDTVNRLTAVVDADGNRTSVTYDAS